MYVHVSIDICILLYTECASALLAVHNVEVNVQNKLGDTALHNAAWKGHAEVASLLLDKGKPILPACLPACLKVHVNEQVLLQTFEITRNKYPMTFLLRIQRWAGY